MLIVSACLAGIRCRHDGGDAGLKGVMSLVGEGKALPVCPEQLGGLPTPRSPAGIINGGGEDVLDGKAEVVNEEGRNVTPEFVGGAQAVTDLAKLVGAGQAILKSGSPSCGCGRIKRKGHLVKGNGVTSALLLRAGVEVVEK